jgi:hypothetical protein
MRKLMFIKSSIVDQVPESHFVVVHPLDDVAEPKVETTALGRMPLTSSVKVSLLALRGYLVLMILLTAYHILTLAGIVGGR